MDWPYFPVVGDAAVHDLLTPEYESEVSGNGGTWSFEDNRQFENALAENGFTDSRAVFEGIAARIPAKSVEEIGSHYRALVEDVKMIESGSVPVPDYPTCAGEYYVNVEKKRKVHGYEMEKTEGKAATGGGGSSSSNARAKPPRNGQTRLKGVPWTEEEHQLFLMGLNKYGKGDWRSISRYYVMSKTPTQVASHAQKYFKRQTSATPLDRRRPSIHDTKSVKPDSWAAIRQGRDASLEYHSFMPFPVSDAQGLLGQYPRLNFHSFDADHNGSTAFMVDPRMFLSMNYSGASSFASADSVMTQPAAASAMFPPPACLFQSLWNQS